MQEGKWRYNIQENMQSILKGTINTQISWLSCKRKEMKTILRYLEINLREGDQAICDFRVYDIGERTAQPPEIQNTQVWYQNKGMVVLFRFQKKISF